MKIGVMTFWETEDNYGQLLQAYALQRALRKMGHEPYLIRYRRVDGSLYRKCRKLFSPKQILKRIREPKRTRNSRGFDSFRSDYLRIGEIEYKTLEDLRKSPPRADVYITGSDQVWNNHLMVPCEPFLLGFGSEIVKRISYAASFGTKELENGTSEIFRKYIHAFDAVSVREESGLAICDRLGYSGTKHVPDPTMLLYKDDWKVLQREASAPVFSPSGESKIFIYTLGNSKIRDRDRFVEYALDTGNVIHTSANEDDSGDAKLTIPEWLNAIEEADFVITNSFHGVVFCILFNTNFISLPNTGAKIGMNERIATVLGRFNLEDHVVHNLDYGMVNAIRSRPVDWNEIDRQVELWRRDGHDFLRDALA